jgi:ketosteroid isomerase-like protein
MAPPRAETELLLAFLDHDLARCRAILPADFVLDDHRRTGMGRLEGAEAYIEAAAAAFGLSADAITEPLYEVARAKHGLLTVAHTFGTLAEGGGEFESVYVYLAHYEGQGFVGAELFELDDLDAARARFEALRPDPLRIPPNAAVRATERWQEAFDRRDWDAIDACYGPSVELDDRRRGMRLAGDRDMALANDRQIGRGPMRVERTLLATAGERLKLMRTLWIGNEHGARFEIEMLDVTEVDAAGRIIASIIFDADDRRAASRELLQRFFAARNVPRVGFEVASAVLDHDLQRCRAALPDGFVLDDHRRTGMGRLEDADAYVAALGALFEESPDAIIEPLYFVAIEKHGFITVAHTFGTLREGGEWESVYVQLAHHPGGALVGAELYEVDDLDVARARLEELRPTAALVPPNAASRARDHADAVVWTSGWREKFRALVTRDFVYDDRSKQALVSGDVELAIKSYEEMRSMPVLRRRCELIGTMGDRIALQHVLFGGGPPSGEFEMERLRLTEVDTEGRIRASLIFDPEDRRQAFVEALARFAAGEAVTSGAQAVIGAFNAAYGAHDLAGMRRCLADDCVLRDHRAVGLLEGLSADAWIESVRVHAELAPDLDAEVFRIVAQSHFGRVDGNRIFGTATDGGPFESVFLRAVLTDGARIRHYEIFDVADVDRALARFDELSAASSAARAAG